MSFISFYSRLALVDDSRGRNRMVHCNSERRSIRAICINISVSVIEFHFQYELAIFCAWLRNIHVVGDGSWWSPSTHFFSSSSSIFSTRYNLRALRRNSFFFFSQPYRVPMNHNYQSVDCIINSTGRWQLPKMGITLEICSWLIINYFRRGKVSFATHPAR